MFGVCDIGVFPGGAPIESLKVTILAHQAKLAVLVNKQLIPNTRQVVVKDVSEKKPWKCKEASKLITKTLNDP